MTGEQITFVETAEQTGGRHLLIEVSLLENGDGPRLHVHKRFMEEFHVIHGHLTVQVGDHQYVLEPGQSITAPMGTAHTFAMHIQSQ